MRRADPVERAIPAPGPSAAGIDWRRLARRVMLGGMIACAVVQLGLAASGTQYGFDFRGGTWSAGHALLSGRSPFPAPDPAALLRAGNGFITPPVLAVIGAPLSLLGFWEATILWNLICGVAMVCAMRLLGVREGRAYVLALGCFPFVSSLVLGQPDGLLVLAAAAAWRYRESPRGAVAVGALIAVKLLAWPLIVWLLVTRRFRLAAVAAGSAIGLLAASWAAIGFKGLASYPRLLGAETRAYGPKSHSYLAALYRLGASLSMAQAGTVLLALATALLILRVSRGGDLGWFTAALTFGLLSSPVVWQHYLVLLFVPLAIGRRLHGPWVWLLVAALWLSPDESPPTLWQTWLVPVIVSALAISAVAHEAPWRSARSLPRRRDPRALLPYLGLGRPRAWGDAGPTPPT